ncbi:transporter substrate-binding domain-containing protein [Synechocystis sp. PCC 6803]|uniref:transporter substrate-binding domain-containing protein n=1 Tax=Synechocystis sp. PCC 6803 TaxID=1148 RepID=UPI0021130006|nr:transporter substrate-binding domain-containing protein [Synechocystis sp. PCC 6803]
MLLKSAFTWLALTFTTGLVAIAPVQAETVLERVARTGELRAGTRTDAVPFGFEMANGEMEGYGVDLMALIALKLAVRPLRLI